MRRWVAGGIAAAGAADLLSTIIAPLRGRLRLILEFLPLASARAAGGLVAFSGIALLALARGVRHGQRRAWAISVVLVSATLVFHLVRGTGIIAASVSFVVLVALVVFRREFHAPSDAPSLRSAVIALVATAAALIVVTTVAVTVRLHVGSHRAHANLSLVHSLEAVTERLVGVQTETLPAHINEFLSPALLAIGVAVLTAAAWLATRPVVLRRLVRGSGGELRAREIIREHGGGTLDYFALRDDKDYFFHQDTVIAYAVLSGICLVSPDPIGPVSQRGAAWDTFRDFANRSGWPVAVFAASDEWLPTYESSGMRHFYYGDEAVVDLDRFSLEGGEMKGLRQAYHRVARYGYTASFHDPSHLDERCTDAVTTLLGQGRRGESERGFSMMLGRVCDPRDVGLLLCLVWGPNGEPAAMCQFVPAPKIRGYSLDLMRRDLGDHPNGLIDFALCSSIEHLRDQGWRAVSLNFAAFRSILDGERGDNLTQRMERWGLKKLSGSLQIESLRTFSAKYQPDWLARHIVFESAGTLVATLTAILTAESIFELPVVGLVIAGRRRSASNAGT